MSEREETLPARLDPFSEISAIADHADVFAGVAEAVADATRAVFRARVLAGGGAPQLRILAKALGPETFMGLLASLAARDLNRLYADVEPHREALRPTDPAGLVSHIAAVADGLEPAPLVVLAELDLDGLRAALASLGREGLEALLKAELKASKEGLDPVLDRLDPHRLGAPHAGSRAIAHLVALAEGQAPIPAVAVEDLDAAGLAAAREALGDAFQAWAAAHAKPLREAVLRIDPHRPGVADLRGAALLAHATALAEGAPPMPALSIEALDVEGIRRAYAELGADFAVWLSARRQSEVKDLLARLDPHRPNVRSLPAKEYPFLVMHIASGGRPASAEGTGLTPGARAKPAAAPSPAPATGDGTEGPSGEPDA